MDIEERFDGEIYEVDVRWEEKERLEHVAHYPIKNGPKTFKSVNVFEPIPSETGKKIVSFWKSRLSEEGDMEIDEETRFECNPVELDRLVAMLDSLEDVVDLERGEYIFMKRDSPSSQAITAAIDSIQQSDSEQIDEIVSHLLEGIAGLDVEEDDVEILADKLDSDILDVENLIAQARTRKTLSEFRELVASDEIEQEYQTFLEEHHWLFGNSYLDRTDQRQLTRDQEVDFCLVTVDGYYDVFEIKRPSHTVLVRDDSHDTYRPSAELSKAVAQVANYLQEIDWNHDDILRRDRMNMIRPRGIIVIGSELSEPQNEALRVYNNHLSRIRVMTYDEILEMGTRIIEIHN